MMIPDPININGKEYPHMREETPEERRLRKQQKTNLCDFCQFCPKDQNKDTSKKQKIIYKWK